MEHLRRSLNPNKKFEKEMEKPYSCQKENPNENSEIFLFRKSNSHEITRFESIFRNKRMKTSFEDSNENSNEDFFEDNNNKPIINIKVNEIREENEKVNDNFPEIHIYYKANFTKNLKNFNRTQSKNLESKIIFPVESPSSEMKKQHQKANSANTKNKPSKNASSQKYLKIQNESFMRIVQALKLENYK